MSDNTHKPTDGPLSHGLLDTLSKLLWPLVHPGVAFPTQRLRTVPGQVGAIAHPLTVPGLTAEQYNKQRNIPLLEVAPYGAPMPTGHVWGTGSATDNELRAEGASEYAVGTSVPGLNANNAQRLADLAAIPRDNPARRAPDIAPINRGARAE